MEFAMGVLNEKLKKRVIVSIIEIRFELFTHAKRVSEWL